MLRLAGGSGRLFVGYELAATLGPWSLEKEVRTLGDYSATGSAVLRSANTFRIGQKATKIELRLGPTTWTWQDGIAHEVDGHIVRLRITGDPTVT